MNSSIPYDASDEPSGHSKRRPDLGFNIRPMDFPTQDYKTNYGSMPIFENFAGPYKDYKPPGNRSPAVGEKSWGDVPYLPSYLDLMYVEEMPTGAADNLYFRGPFYKGVSETHTEFVNRGVLPKRQYHEHVRHYEEPGMKHDKSVTHEDYQPPRPMLPRDETPCLKEDLSKPWYEPERKKPKNPHAKEHELRTQVPQVVYVDEETKRDFNTEHTDKYVCYQKNKTGSKIQEPRPAPEEIFLANIRGSHQQCSHSPLADNSYECSKKVGNRCPGATPKRTSWLLHPKNYAFENGVMLLPCKCRKAEPTSEH